MGSRGSTSGISKIENQIANIEVELKYAVMKANEYGNVRYGGTLATRERFWMWSERAAKLRKQLLSLEARRKPRRKRSGGKDTPLF